MDRLFSFLAFLANPLASAMTAAPQLADNLENAANMLFGHINSIVSSVFFFNVLFFTDHYNVPLAVAWLVFGSIFFTLKFRFTNFRFFRHAIALTFGYYDKKDSEGDVNHFKALTTALSATLGLGNIAGVAIAISMGGPGATFWIIIAGLLGMSSKLAECTLAQMYRRHATDGTILGGPMLYLQKGFADIGWVRFGKFLSIFFALLCVAGSFGGAGSFQVNQSMYALAEVMPVVLNYKWLYGLIMAGMVGLVIIGGIKRIADVAEKVVPIMCALYMIMTVYILVIYVDMIPMAFGKIISEAFHPNAMYGGFIGVLVTGFRRAAFSNEAGMGSAAIAHSAAKTQVPVQEGLVSLLEPFIDTVVVCTMTALVLVITGAYNNPAYIDLIHSQNGTGLTSRAMGQAHWLFPYVLGLVVFLFAYATIISWSYYGERAFIFIFGEKTSIIYKSVLLVVLFSGAITTSTNLMDFGDLMILGMSFPNLVGVYLLSGRVKTAIDEYAVMLKSGKIVRSK
jgi:alanine or glycine:cation symporter, AGCS family